MNLTVPQIEDVGMTYGRLREGGADIAACIKEAAAKVRDYQPDIDRRTAEQWVRVIVVDGVGEL